MSYVIKIVGLSRGERSYVDGMYLASFDPDAFVGVGEMVGASDVQKAQRFATKKEAHEFWRQPTKYGRALTAYTIIIEEVSDVSSG